MSDTSSSLLEDNLKNKPLPSFSQALLCFAGVFSLVFAGLFVYDINLHITILLTIIWASVQARWIGYSFDEIRLMMNDGIAKALPAIYIFFLACINPIPKTTIMIDTNGFSILSSAYGA